MSYLQRFKKSLSIFTIVSLLFQFVAVPVTYAFHETNVSISEFMANPSGSDSKKEWLEVQNNSESSIDLEGWKIQEGEQGKSQSEKVIEGSYSIPAGGFGLICLSIDEAQNGGVVCNYTTTPNFQLSQTANKKGKF